MEIVLSILHALQNNLLLAFGIVFWAGLLISLGVYTIVVRLPLILGYIHQSASSRKVTVILTLSFITGLVVAYILIGILLSIFSFLLSSLFKCQTYVYYFLGVVTLILSIYFKR